MVKFGGSVAATAASWRTESRSIAAVQGVPAAKRAPPPLGDDRTIEINMSARI